MNSRAQRNATEEDKRDSQRSVATHCILKGFCFDEKSYQECQKHLVLCQLLQMIVMHVGKWLVMIVQGHEEQGYAEATDELVVSAHEDCAENTGE